MQMVQEQKNKIKIRKCGNCYVSVGGETACGWGWGWGLRRTSMQAQKRMDVDACLYSAVIHKVESTTKLFATV